MLIWSGLLLVLYAGNWVWEGKKIDTGQTLFAVALILAWAIGIALASRHALRGGAPARETEPETAPEASFGSAGLAIAVAIAAFGAIFGHFLYYFGAAVALLSLGRIALEVRASRRTRAGVLTAREGEPGGEAPR